MSSGFWDKKVKSPVEVAAAQAEALEKSVTLDEQAFAEMQNEELDLLEEDEDTAFLMTDANLRLEQGRLYQMVLQGNIFADTNADPKAIRNVQREIRKFVRERMETMLGIRQEQTAMQTIVSSPFNDLEVTVLKMLASKMSKGATENETVAPAPVQPKKDGITSISGNLRPNAPVSPVGTPLRKENKPQKTQSAKPAVKSSSEEETLLTKPVAEMTPQELMDYEAAAAKRRATNKSAMPTDMVPHPTPQQLEMMYTQSASQLSIANPWRANGIN